MNNKAFDDMLGTTLGSIDAGKLREFHRDAFGATLPRHDGNTALRHYDTTASQQNDFFTGKPQVAGLGNVFLFRNYRPELGKWQTSDPLGYPDGWNNLAYCNNMVTDYIDILGTDVIELHDTGGSIFGHSAQIVIWKSAGVVNATYFDYGMSSTGSTSSDVGMFSGSDYDTVLTNCICALDPAGNRFEGMHRWKTTVNESIDARASMIEYVGEQYTPDDHNCRGTLTTGLDAAGKQGEYSPSPLPNEAFEQDEAQSGLFGIIIETDKLHRIQQNIRNGLAE